MSEKRISWLNFGQTLLATVACAAIALAGSYFLQERVLSAQIQSHAFDSRIASYARFNRLSVGFLEGPLSLQEYKDFQYALNELALLASENVRLATADVHLEAMNVQRGDNSRIDVLSIRRSAFRLAVREEAGMATE